MIINPKTIVKRGILQGAEGEQVQQNGIDIRVENDVVIPPKSFQNIMCIESVFVPRDMAAFLQIRSSYSRRGIFCTSGAWDSGFQGRLGCSLYNLSDKPIIIPTGERIAQIIFHEADSAGMYNGQYQGIGLDQNQQKLPVCEHGKEVGDCGICAEGDPIKFHVKESELTGK